MIHLLILVALYFLPTIVANGRHVTCVGGITMVNLFLGWTGIGWLVALIWAITAPTWYEVYAQPPYPPYPPRYW